jgi:hypothetical protein
MKKILIPVGLLMTMSFSCYKTYENYQLSIALENIQEMNEYMIEDINSGVIDEAYGAYYSEKLYETETLLIDWFDDYNSKRPSISVEELQAKIDNYHN